MHSQFKGKFETGTQNREKTLLEPAASLLYIQQWISCSFVTRKSIFMYKIVKWSAALELKGLMNNLFCFFYHFSFRHWGNLKFSILPDDTSMQSEQLGDLTFDPAISGWPDLPTDQPPPKPQ